MQERKPDDLFEAVEAVYRDSSRSHRKFAKWLLENPTTALELTLDELADATGTSRSTILRFCQLLEIDGFRGLKRLLARPVGQLTKKTNSDPVVDWAYKATNDTVRETFLHFDRESFEKAGQLCAKARYLLWFGSTESGALAHCAVHKSSMLGMNAQLFIDYGTFANQSKLVSAEDVFIAISWGGDGDHLRKPVLLAKDLGLTVIGITVNRFSWLTQIAEVSLIAGGKYTQHGDQQVTIRAGQEALVNSLVLKTASCRGIPWHTS